MVVERRPISVRALLTSKWLLGQPTGLLSKEVCLYAGADWLNLVCQSEVEERSTEQLRLTDLKIVFCSGHNE